MNAASSGGRARPSLPARIGLHTLLLLFSTLMLAPFGVMLLVSLVPLPAFLARDFSPAHYSLQNYARTFAAVPFGLYYANSTLVAVSVTVLQILISSLAAFAFARLRFRGRDLIFLFYLATLMIPFPAGSIPIRELSCREQQSPTAPFCCASISERCPTRSWMQPKWTAPATSVHSGRSCCRWPDRRSSPWPC